MADSSVLLEVIVEGKNIKLVQREVEELGAAVNRTSQAQESSAMSSEKTSQAQEKQTKSGKQLYDNQRALANGSLSQGRANSKLASGISGTLVPAYAEIASRIFAISQAFGLLQRAQALAILRDNLEQTGAAAGQNLAFVADGLRDITDGALSAKDALQATANATAQGFSSTQLEGLTRVAKGAASALGRDLTDSLDRLVRGTAKLEPEILDELGIIVRLDDATREYAARLGKTAGDLTQFERQQAFLNATLEQGEKKFGSLADSTQTNPYSKLSASFTDLTQTLVEFANVAIVPIVNFFSQNKIALTGALLIFAKTIFDRLSPALDELRANSSALLKDLGALANQAGSAFRDEIGSAAQAIEASTANLPRGFKDLKSSILDGTATVPQLDAAIQSLERSETARYRNLEKYSGRDRVLKEAELGDIIALREQTEKLRDARAELEGKEFKLFDAESSLAFQEVLDGSLDSIAAAEGPLDILRATGDGLGNSFNTLGDQLGNLGQTFTRSNRGATLFTRGANVGRLAASGFSVALRGLGTAAAIAGQGLLRLVPYIGLIMLAYDAAKSVINFFFEETAAEKKAKEVQESFASIGTAAEELQQTLNKTELPPAEKNLARLKASSGVLDQLASGLNKIEAAGSDAFKDAIEDANTFRENIRDNIDLANALTGEKDTVYIARQKRKLKDAEDRIAALQEERVISRKLALETTDSFINEVEQNKEILKSVGDRIDRIREIRELIVRTNDPAQVQAYVDQINKLAQTEAKRLSAVQGLAEALSNVSKEALDFAKKEDTRFSKQIANYKAIENQLRVIAETRSGSIEDQNILSDEELDSIKALATAFENSLDLGRDFAKLPLDKKIETAVDKMQDLEDAIRTAKQEAKELENSAKRYAQVAANSAILQGQAVDIGNQAIDRTIQSRRDEIALIRATLEGQVEIARTRAQTAQDNLRNAQTERNILGQLKADEQEIQDAQNEAQAASLAVTEAEASLKRVTLQNEADILALEESKVDKAERAFKVEIARVKGLQRTLDLNRKISAEAEKQLANTAQIARSTLEIERARQGSNLTAEDEANLTIAANNAKINAEEGRLALQIEGIELEYDLLEAKAKFEKARIQALIKEKQQENPTADVSELEEAVRLQNNYVTLLGTAEQSAIRGARAQSQTNVTLLRNSNTLLDIKAQQEGVTLEVSKQRALIESVASLDSMGLTRLLERNVLLQEISTLQAEYNSMTDDNNAKTQKGIELQNKRNELRSLEVEILDEVVARENELAQKRVGELKKRVDLETELATLRNTNPFTGEVKDVFKQAQIEEEARRRRLEVAQLEATIKKAIIDQEFNLLKTRSKLLIEELRAKGVDGSALSTLESAQNELFAQQEKLIEMQKANIDLELQVLRERTDFERIRSASEAIKAESSGAVGSGLVQASAQIAAILAPKKPEKTEEINREQSEKLKEIFGTDVEGKLEGGFGDVAKTVMKSAAAAGVSAQNTMGTIKETSSTICQCIAEAAQKICLAIQAAFPRSTGPGQEIQPGGALDTGAPTATGTAANEGTSPTAQNADNMGDPNLAGAPVDRSNPDQFGSDVAQGAFLDSSRADSDAAFNASNRAEANSTREAGMAEASAPPAGLDMAMEGPSLPDATEAAEAGGEAGAENAITFAQGAMAARLAVQGLATDLAKLGPEGEAVSQMIEGGLQIVDGFSQMAEGGLNAKSILQGVGSIIAGIGQMQAASSKMRIAAIDQEIAAEKKRDGKSKESLAKLSALEQKKEKEKKKAFEQDKKIKIAQTIIATITGAMQAYQSLAGIPFVGPFLGAAMAAFVISMGMKQVAMIKATQYQGGGSAGGAPSSPPTIAVGERKNTVDLASSKSASGELGYIRGAQGQGNANNFRPTPAFTGYRAAGGNVGYMVGEQGPELFIPETPGTILPEDQTTQMMERPAQNVNFSINTIDATGVEEVLTNQQGTIIKMLRDAANSYGDLFMENVETGVYTPGSQGAKKAGSP